MSAINLTPPKIWDWLLFASIGLYIIIPSIYSSYSIYLIGNTPPNENNLEVMAQWQFVQVLFEVVQEALVFPIFYFVGSQISSNKEVILERIKTSLVILLLILLPIIMIVLLGIDYFIDSIGTDEGIVSETKTYLSIKIGALLFSVFNVALIIIVESLKFKKTLFFLVFVKLLLFVFFDSLFFGGYNYSLDMGVVGVGVSNLLVEFFIFIFLFGGILRSFNISLAQFLKIPSFKNLRLFNQVSLGIAIESLVKNIAYFVMILKLLNNIGSKEIGGYYLAMHLFWSFFLVPTFVISDTLKVLIANKSNQISEVWKLLKFGTLLCLAINFVFLLLLPFIEPILTFFSDDFTLVEFGKEAVIFLMIPYLLLSFNLVISSVFYGLGKTNYLALKTLWTNGLVYFTAYVLYLSGIWEPEFKEVLLLFGAGILVGTFFTVYYVRRVLTKQEYFIKK